MNDNSIKTSALEKRIKSQKNQTIDLNKWIFDNLNIRNNENVLELCCGTGAQTKLFAEHISTGSIVCVDINAKSIQNSKSLNNLDKVAFISADIDNTEDYIDSKYDLIFSAYGFYYSKNPELLHNKLIKYIGDNGRFVLVGPILGNNKQLYKIVKEIGCEIPDSVMHGSEFFLLRFLEIFLSKYSTIKMFRTINSISYDSNETLLDYWKNTTFYTSGYDEKFLDASDAYFKEEIIINKSIAYLEGCL